MPQPQREKSPLKLADGKPAEAEGDGKRKKSKWDDQGDGTNKVPDWLKDLMPKTAPGPPPGVKPENYKCLEMDATQIRAVIGRGGETVQGIRVKSGQEVKIDFPANESVGRVIMIGEVEKVEALVREALAARGCPLGGIPPPPGGLPPHLAGLPLPPGVAPPPPPGGVPPPPAGPAPVEHREVSIPGDLVPLFIGNGATAINELRKQAGMGAQIAVLGTTAIGGPQICRVSAAPPTIDHVENIVKQRVEELVKQNPRPPSSSFPPSFNPMMQMPPMRPMMGPPGGMGQPGSMGQGLSGPLPPGPHGGMNNNGSAGGGAVEHREIPVPAEVIGGIIGPQGATINELRKQAGSNVLIAIVPGSVPASQGGQQTVKISGQTQAVDGAEALVRAKLQELQEAKPRGTPPQGQMVPPPADASQTMPSSWASGPSALDGPPGLSQTGPVPISSGPPPLIDGPPGLQGQTGPAPGVEGGSDSNALLGSSVAKAGVPQSPPGLSAPTNLSAPPGLQDSSLVPSSFSSDVAVPKVVRPPGPKGSAPSMGSTAKSSGAPPPDVAASGDAKPWRSESAPWNNKSGGQQSNGNSWNDSWDKGDSSAIPVSWGQQPSGSDWGSNNYGWNSRGDGGGSWGAGNSGSWQS